MSRGALLAACLMLSLGGSVRAQDRRELELRVDELVRTWREAEARHSAYLDGLRQEVRSSFMVGPLRVETTAPQYSHLAHFAADSALRELSPVYGRALERMSQYQLLVEIVPPDRWREAELVVAILGEKGARHGGRWGAPDTVIQTRNFRDVILQALSGHDMPATAARNTAVHNLSAWLRGAFPVDTPRTADYIEARTALLTTTSILGRSCYEGDTAACRLALGIDIAADPATQWFDSTARRAFVQADAHFWRRVANFGDQSLRALAAECLEGADSACIEVIRRYPDPGLPDPIPSLYREQLLRLAIAVGGTAAMERALLTEGSVGDRLAAAAGVSVDSLMGLWVARLQAAGGKSEAMSLRIAAMSTFWVLVCLGLSLRSSRWR